ncbi:hypothetical protein [Ancylobacter terrae]|uniref:hypothetical protein n=1 Tax=Ancylobacter sp. sgz301288 TaxID=3342077 RepID=UPI00385EC75D
MEAVSFALLATPAGKAAAAALFGTTVTWPDCTADAAYEAAWSGALDRVEASLAQSAMGAGISDPVLVREIQDQGIAAFSDEFDRLNGAWIQPGGRA